MTDILPIHGEEALARAKALVGGNTALAALLTERGAPISPQAVSQWRRVPGERVIEVEKATTVSRHDLRPDLYPSEDHAGGFSSPAGAAPATGTSS